MNGNDTKKRRVTIRITADVMRKARILAARRSLSISDLLVGHLERLLGEEEEYERSEQRALLLPDSGFHLGGSFPTARNELHER